MRLAVVCVHFHAADLAVQALDAIRKDASSSSLDYRAIIVDNGSTPAEAEVLRSSGARIVESSGNSGYAGGVNRGAAELLSSADVLIAMNPDVWVQPGCLGALVDELRSGAAVAGPRFFWDRVGGYQLPPTEACGRPQELVRALAGRGGHWMARARRSWRRHAHRHWKSTDPIPTYDLSGALLAVSADAWRQVGPFDEGYPLYFEETDWLQRCRRLRLASKYVGRAEAIHLYAQSTPTEPRAQQWFAESQKRFRSRYYGGTFVALLNRLAHGPGVDPASALEQLDPSATWPSERAIEWVEISPSSMGFPAAALRLEGPSQEPVIGNALWSRMAPGRYFLRSVFPDGTEGPQAMVLKGNDRAESDD